MTLRTPSGPTAFGKYLLDGQIAEGGMARVYGARLRGPGGFEKRLVVKQILPKFARDPEFVELFVREANTLVQMSHPHIVPVYELGVVDGVYFLALEWVEGVTFKQLLKHAHLQPEMVAHVGVQVCDALRYAFGRFEVVHRDVTPRNIMVDRDGHTRLLDFGIASPVADTGGAGIFGSPGFMAPEQLRGDTLDARTDLFALGAVLYQGLCGHAAFPDRKAARHAETLGEAAPPPAEVDTELGGIVMRMLSTDPAGRPRDAAEAGATLRSWLSARRPDGVAQELGAQVVQVQEDHPTTAPMTQGPGAGGSSPAQELGAAATPATEVQTLATSRDLEQLIQQATERIESRPPPRVPPGNGGAQSPVAAKPGVGAGPAPLVEGREVAEPAEASQSPAAVVVTSGSLRRFLWPLLALATAALIFFFESATPDQSGEPAAPHERVESPRPLPAPAAAVGSAALVAPDASTASGPAVAERGSTRDRVTESGTEPAAERQGQMSINALPWGNVRVDGREQGRTPLRSLSLSEGKHTVTVSCPPLGREASTPIQVRSGTRTRVLVDLNRDPPAVTVD